MKLKIVAATLLLTNTILWAQTTLIPYRNGSLWGLCDKKLNMVLAPSFDSISCIDYLQLHKLFKNGNRGVAYQGKIVIAPNPNYDYYNENSTFIVEFDRNNSQLNHAVYNLNGEKLIDQPIQQIKITTSLRPSDPMVVVVEGNNSGAFVYNPKNKKIVQWLFKNKNGYIDCQFKPNDNAIHIYFNDNKTDKSYYYKATFNSKLKKYELTVDKASAMSDLNNSDQEVTEESIENHTFYEVKNNYAERFFSFATKKGKTRLLRTDRRYHDSKFKHDSIFFDLPETDLKINNFIQGNGYKLDVYDTSPYNDSDKEKIDTVFTYYNYLTYKKDNKIGLVIGAKVWEAKYDSIRYFRAGSTLKPYFLVAIKDEQEPTKWGVIAADDKVLLPCIYDEIIVNLNGGYGTLWAIKQNGRYGIANNQGKILKEPQYDKVYPKELFYAMHIIQNNKYGWYSYDDVFHEPIFPYEIYFDETFNKERFIKLIDKKGKLKGYANFDGTLYFKE